MKNNKLLKISLLVLSFALVIGAAFAMSINAADESTNTEPKLEIVSQNVFYTDSFQLMFAVTAENITTDVIALNVYEDHPDSGADYLPYFLNVTDITTGETSGLKDANGNPLDAYIFQLDGVSAKNLTKEYYVQAVAGDEANSPKSEIKKYSVAEYLYERLSKTKAITPYQEAFYQSVIDFGKDAQLLFDNSGATLISDLTYVTVNGGTINGFSKGVYPKGEKYTVRAPGAITANWSVVTTDAEGAGEPVTASHYVTLADDAIKTEISFVEGSAKLYRKEALTFSDKTLGSEIKDVLTKFQKSGGTNEGIYEYVDNDRGTVMKMDLRLDANGYMDYGKWWGHLTDAVTADTATAVELSFDLKLEPDEISGGDNYFMTQFLTGTSAVYQPGFRFNTSGNLEITQRYTTKDTVTTVHTGDWFHVRIVVYKDITGEDANIYFYINGSDTPYSYALDAKYVKDISLIDGCDFRIQYPVSNGIYYIDNLFFGYTTDTK